MTSAFDFADTRTLIQHALSIQYRKLPQQAITQSKIFIADSIGVALAGHQGSFAQALIAHCKDFGGKPQARVLGTDLRLPAAHAAMVNAYLIHCLEFDCVHEPAVVHPMAVILASLLSYCDDKPNITGDALIASIVASVDVAATLGCASRSKLRFFRPAQCGAIGAAVGLAKLAAWNTDQTLNLLGILLGQLSGTMQAHREGKSSLPMQIAVNARHVLSAFDFANRGLEGPMAAIEGEFGYLNLFETQHDFAAALRDRLQLANQGQFAIMEVSHKPFPSGRATHGGLQALEIIQSQHEIDLTQIKKITLHAPPLICQLVDRPFHANASSSYLRLCFPFCATLFLTAKQLSPLAFDARQSADFEALTNKISVLVDSNPDVNALSPIRVTLEVYSGRVFEQRISDVWGSPRARLDQTSHTKKLAQNISLFDQKNAVARLERLRSCIDSLETNKVMSLMDACTAV
jgi:aconitate decarboxylase